MPMCGYTLSLIFVHVWTKQLLLLYPEPSAECAGLVYLYSCTGCAAAYLPDTSCYSFVASEKEVYKH